jgi:histidine triad (HIT) family protein
LSTKLPLMTNKTLFQKIMNREEPGDILYEDDLCVALRDINPQAPTHVLIVPRKPIPTLDDLTEKDEPLVGHLFLVAQRVAVQEGSHGQPGRKWGGRGEQALACCGNTGPPYPTGGLDLEEGAPSIASRQ